MAPRRKHRLETRLGEPTVASKLSFVLSVRINASTSPVMRRGNKVNMVLF